MSQIPQRRGTRVTRALPDENATRKLARPATRAASKTDADAQPLGLKDAAPLNTTATAAARSRATSTADAAAQKRKRDALGEVTNGKAKAGAAAKGKERAALKPIKEPQAAPSTRPALATRASSTRQLVPARSSSTSTVVPRAPVHVDGAETADAMAIDSPDKNAQPPVRRSLLPTAAGAVVRRQSSKQLVLEVPRVRPGGPLRQSRKQLTIRETVEIDEEEAHRAHKKRRTSSEADELEQQDRQLQVLSSDDADVAPAPSLMEQLEQQNDEAEAADAGWEDLDAEDADDPLMVAEYVVDIFNYLKTIEKTTMPNANYMNDQDTMTWAIRGTLVDWMISIHARFRFLPETLFLSVNILDRFLTMRLASVDKLQLVGAAAVFIAAKVEEMFTPAAMRLVEISDDAFSEADLLKAERYMLKTIEWNLSYPSPLNFLRRISKADEYNTKVRTLAKFFLEIGVVEWRLLATPPSMLAAASMWLGRLVLGEGEWNANLIHYSGYTEEAIIPVANIMINFLLKPMRHEHFWKKYSAKKFYRASRYMREWALTHWEENMPVRLAEDLAALRAAAAEQQAEAGDLLEGEQA